MNKLFRNRQNSGITLIALVITIVILIILAGVGINLSIGENGIFNKATQARDEYINAQIDEEQKINILSEQLSAERQLVTAITLSKETATIKTGNVETLIATIAPENATNKNIVWSSDNTDVATVDSSGVVTAVATGTATITATAQDGSNISTSCVVTVENSKISVTQVAYAYSYTEGASVRGDSNITIDNSEHKHKKVIITAPKKDTSSGLSGISITARYRIGTGSWVKFTTAQELDMTDVESVSIWIAVNGSGSVGKYAGATVNVTVETTFNAKLSFRDTANAYTYTDNATARGDSRIAIDNSEQKYTKATITAPQNSTSGLSISSSGANYRIGTTGSFVTFSKAQELDITNEESLFINLSLLGSGTNGSVASRWVNVTLE